MSERPREKAPIIVINIVADTSDLSKDYIAEITTTLLALVRKYPQLVKDFNNDEAVVTVLLHINTALYNKSFLAEVTVDLVGFTKTFPALVKNFQSVEEEE